MDAILVDENLIDEAYKLTNLNSKLVDTSVWSLVFRKKQLNSI